MRITRIDVEDDSGTRFGRMSRKRDSSSIEVELLTPDHEDTIRCAAGATAVEERDDRWATAECVQLMLDGVRGTNSMIHDYFNLITSLAD